MAWEENSCICLNMQLIAILSRIGVSLTVSNLRTDVTSDEFFQKTFYGLFTADSLSANCRIQ